MADNLKHAKNRVHIINWNNEEIFEGLLSAFPGIHQVLDLQSPRPPIQSMTQAKETIRAAIKNARLALFHLLLKIHMNYVKDFPFLDRFVRILWRRYLATRTSEVPVHVSPKQERAMWSPKIILSGEEYQDVNCLLVAIDHAHQYTLSIASLKAGATVIFIDCEGVHEQRFEYPPLEYEVRNSSSGSGLSYFPNFSDFFESRRMQTQRADGKSLLLIADGDQGLQPHSLDLLMLRKTLILNNFTRLDISSHNSTLNQILLHEQGFQANLTSFSAYAGISSSLFVEFLNQFDMVINLSSCSAARWQVYCRALGIKYIENSVFWNSESFDSEWNLMDFDAALRRLLNCFEVPTPPEAPKMSFSEWRNFLVDIVETAINLHDN